MEATFFSQCLSLLCFLSLSFCFQMYFLIVFLALVPALSELRLTLAGRWASLGKESLQSVAGCFYSAVMFRIKSHRRGGLTHCWGSDCDLVLLLGL